MKSPCTVVTNKISLEDIPYKDAKVNDTLCEKLETSKYHSNCLPHEIIHRSLLLWKHNPNEVVSEPITNATSTLNFTQHETSFFQSNIHGYTIIITSSQLFQVSKVCLHIWLNIWTLPFQILSLRLCQMRHSNIATLPTVSLFSLLHKAKIWSMIVVCWGTLLCKTKERLAAPQLIYNHKW
jgi:hypothetical protein